MSDGLFQFFYVFGLLRRLLYLDFSDHFFSFPLNIMRQFSCVFEKKEIRLYEKFKSRLPPGRKF